MATISATQFVSRINCGGTAPKYILKQINMKNQSMTHSGLRSLSKVGFLQIKNTQKAASRELRRNAFQTDKGTVAGEVKCSSGMNLVFANGHRVMTVSPLYNKYKDVWDTNVSVEVWGKTGSKIYGPNTGSDYQDNQLRFCLLSLAALEAPRVLNLNSNKYFSGTYGEEVMFIANDWHTSLLPCYLKIMYQSKGMYETAKVAYCIHNIAYQGRFSFSDFALLNLLDSFRSSFDFIDGYEKHVKGRKINSMKAGILEVDKVVTVSPYYAEELALGPDKGVELDSIIRKTGCLGIINGMDVQEWNPLTDKYINVTYDASTAEVGLPVDCNIPVIGFIGRLEEQKGSDILSAAIPEFIDEEVQISFFLEQLETLYPGKARGVAKFNVPLAHMIIVEADFLMIPSRFEPCGLIQLHARRYGTVPIVASTGGLVDTIKEGFTGFQMGAFNVEAIDPVDVTAIATTTKKALETYGTPTLIEIIQNCMAQDISWKGTSKNLEDMLLGLEVAGSELGIEGDEIAPLVL
ncbi:hypothetical protein MKX03_030012 [Papaver bracteatum]|nr:hypothetical protein MKX03_030012 [Papaver bracteatum]